MPPRFTVLDDHSRGQADRLPRAHAGRAPADAEAAAVAASRRGADVVCARPPVELRGGSARGAARSARPRSGADPAWRPGGSHEDPRARFKIPRDEKRRRFRERLFRDDEPEDRGVPASIETTGRPDLRGRGQRLPRGRGRESARRGVMATSRGVSLRIGRGQARIWPAVRPQTWLEAKPASWRRQRRRQGSWLEAKAAPGTGDGAHRGWKPSRPTGRELAQAIEAGSRIGPRAGNRVRRSRLEARPATEPSGGTAASVAAGRQAADAEAAAEGRGSSR